jgi:chromosome segregation ATPase
MRKKSLFYRLTLGLLIGAMIMPAQPAQAQFGLGGIVFDPKNFGENVQKRLEDAQRFSKMFDNAVKQYTTLRGVLTGVDDLVAKQNNAILTMANVGRTIRASLDLKDQVEAIVTTRLTMLNSIDDRLRRGIFDPEADLRDLEDYLRNSIGRSSQDSLANLNRLRRMDNTLERLIRDLRKAEYALSVVQGKRSELRVQLIRMTSLGFGEGDAGVQSITDQIADCDMQIQQYESEIKELRGKIEEHTKKYHVLNDERIKFAEKVGATNKAWTEFNDTLDEINKTLNEY